jgi:hypothetical protein
VHADLRTHIDKLSSFSNGMESRISYRSRITGKRQHRAVGSRAGIHMQQMRPGYVAYCFGYSI